MGLVERDLAEYERTEDEEEMLDEAYVEYLDWCATIGSTPVGRDKFKKSLLDEAEVDKLIEKLVDDYFDK